MTLTDHTTPLPVKSHYTSSHDDYVRYFKPASPKGKALPLKPQKQNGCGDAAAVLQNELLAFAESGKPTACSSIQVDGEKVPVYTNSFWTPKQRASNPLHQVTYHGCFKAELPRFFIERLTSPGDVVDDRFMGRGTTLIEAALLGRVPVGCDVNPLSAILTQPRLAPPTITAVRQRLSEINFRQDGELRKDLLVFYHSETLHEICALRSYLLEKERCNNLDAVDRWIRMVATTRLTGHSSGFFSVRTLPPNQAVSVESQRRINEKHKQTPPRRKVAELIMKKSKHLLKGVTDDIRLTLTRVASQSTLITASADHTPQIQAESVNLVVTSPPFLDVVDYAKDNWLRAWFCGIDIGSVNLWQLKNLEVWEAYMTRVMFELRRVLKPGGYVAFEVGEVRKGKVKLEESVIRVGARAGLKPVLVMVNDQRFTKTSNCWGVKNNKKGTNTNRIVLFRKEESRPAPLNNCA